MCLPSLGHFLDPRPARDAEQRPILNAVNIPLQDLENRIHELPPRHATVRLAGPDTERTAEFLRSGGRNVELAEDWEFGSGPQCRLWEPNAFLWDVASQLPPGRALDLACGSGRDAVALAGLGWQVTAIDHLEDAIDRGRDLARRYLPPDGAARITWLRWDLESAPLDLTDHYDLISMFWYLNRQLIAQGEDLLAPEGNLVVETFTSVHRERFGKPRTEAFVLQPGELRFLARHLAIGSYDESWHADRHSARLWAIAG
jgi:tellurite methyltransferase